MRGVQAILEGERRMTLLRTEKTLQLLTILAVLASLALMLAGAALRASAAGCDKIASPLGSDAYPGNASEPYATFEHLANSLKPGQVGCLRAGVYQGDARIS